ncbi:hypothetical protein [Microbacterium sp. 179-I 3D3 NHS]|uniref:hypothetical protein n=1 Tax=Microbacterium sp. 179-I 3D3 NHS TaxID=3142382 RepID=UPI0039A1CD2A
MPVITVATAAHPDERALLASVADAVAHALALAPGDVIAMSTPVRQTVVNGADAAPEPWTLISIHGSDRGAEKTQRALAAARAAAADWSRRHDPAARGGAEQERVWCEWLLPQHP